MKLLVFAHTPPPHHGQSYMVQMLLDSLGSEARRAGIGPRAVRCYHVDARFSDDFAEIGRAGWRKLMRALGFCARAIWCRIRHGADHLYFVPASPARVPLYRDWLVLALCRPFFRRLVYHWHACGLGDWLANEARPWERRISRWICGQPDLSIVLRPFNRRDGEAVESRRIAIVPNGIPDPCPEFEGEVLPRRLARIVARRRLQEGEALSCAEAGAAGSEPRVYQLLYTGLCTREKGLFDALDGVALANARLESSPLRLRLTVAGAFRSDAERRQFDRRLGSSDLQDSSEPIVRYRGFVAGADKNRLFVEADGLCFPSYYPAENFPLVLVEGMAYGLTLIATTWRELSELLPPGGACVVEPKSPEQVAEAVLACMTADYDPRLREWFLTRYTAERFANNIVTALLGES